jgi:filamentous hemagglutinin family protein
MTHATHRSTLTRALPARRGSRPLRQTSLRPLVAALAMAFPVVSSAAGALPVAAGTWIKGSNAAAGVTAATKSQTATMLNINQNASRVIYQWSSFDIGAGNTVNFNMAGTGYAALNRVVGNTNPTNILGALNATNGGEIFIINPNGIIFGANAQVNVGSLVASTLDIRDSDFLAGLSSISGDTPTFSWKYADGDDAAATPLYYADAVVQVESGANITTTSGGRVFLFAPKVVNSGTINTPHGQTVLAAGSEIYLNSAAKEALYASESNASVPALRGLLVEVNGSGTATNDGTINADYGNATIVAAAVNQNGRVRATSSVSENGSVFLLARSDVTVGGTADVGYTKRAQTGGTLTLGAGSSVELPVDTSSDTITSSSTFTAPRVELSGQTITLKDGASIVAHGGIVRARAEATPYYEDGGVNDPTNAHTTSLGADGKSANTQATISIGQNAVIDVSGTTNAVISGTRNYLTTQALGKIDLANDSTQKDGVLYLATPTLDARLSSSIVDVSSLTSTVGRTAAEKLSSGGSINLVSTGSVVTASSSKLDVSGGQVAYTAVTAADKIKLTLLKDAAGNVYTVNNAPEDRTYTIVDASLTPTVKQAAYVEGKAGGAVNVTASQVVLDGQIKGTTVQGVRQAAGTDASAAAAKLNVNLLANASTTVAQTDILNRLNLRIGSEAATVNSGYWSDDADWQQLDASLGSHISAQALRGGVGNITLSTQGSATVDAGVNLSFAPETSFSLSTTNLIDVAGSLTFNASYASSGGSLTLSTAGLLSVADGVSFDVSGRFVNLYRDGAFASRLGTVGGTVSLSGSQGVLLGDGGTIDVSGGALLSTTGALSVSNAGSVTIAANAGGADGTMPFHQGKTLRGYAVASGTSTGKGGSLKLVADSVEIGSASSTAAQLMLSPDFFQTGGFASYDITGVHGLQVDANTTISPRQASWVLPGSKSWLNVATGTPLSGVTQARVQPLAYRTATNLTLRTAASEPKAGSTGALVVERGAVVDADAGAAVRLLASGNLLDFEGSIIAHGGSVSLSLTDNTSLAGLSQAGALAQLGTLWLGADSLIDVSGTTVLTPTTNGLRQGKVLSGGAVSIATTHNGTGVSSLIVQQQGSTIDLRGASDTLVVSTTTGTGTKLLPTALATEGGSLTIAASRGAVLEGEVYAQGGNSTTAAGSLTLSVQPTTLPSDTSVSGALPQAYQITLQDAGTTSTQGMSVADAASLKTASHYGQAVVASSWLDQAGYADVRLSAADKIAAQGSTTVVAQRSLVLSAPVYSLAALGSGETLTLRAPQVVFGNAGTDAADQTVGDLSDASSNRGDLLIQANQVRLKGVTTLQGVQDFKVQASGDTQLVGVLSSTIGGDSTLSSTGDPRLAGSLNTSGNVTISAAQVYPVTDERYTINASQGLVRFTGGDTSATVPLSAGGSLTVNATSIEQDGVVRAPFGTLEFNADQVTFGSGSLTSVSGAGLVVPFGSTTDGAVQINDVDRLALISKSISVNTTGSATVSDGAAIDLSGGGTLQAYEFVSGSGGTINKYKDGSGYYAIVPSAAANATGYADYNSTLSGGTGGSGITPGLQITIGEGSSLPAGTYTVLPASYGQLPGAYLIKADSARSGVTTMDAAALKLSDGSYSVAGYLSSAGTSYRSATATRFIVMSQDVAAKTTEIKTTSLSSYFAEQASHANTAVPLLTQDGGALRFYTPALSLAADTLKFDRGSDSAVGGTLEIASNHIHVGDDLGSETAADGSTVLTLSAAALSSAGAQNLVLGATTSTSLDANGNRALNVVASDITIDGSARAISAADVTLAALQTVTLRDGAQVAATGSASGAVTYAASGSGATLRVSSNADVTVVRTGATSGSVGDVTVGANAVLAGKSITIEGANQAAIDASAKLTAQTFTVGAQRVVVGQANASQQSGAFVYSTALASQLASISSQVLRSYSSLDIYNADGGTLQLGSSSLGSLTLDAGAINANGAGGSVLVEAGSVRLQNSTGTDVTPVANINGVDKLTIQADAGDVIVGPGNVAIAGASTTALSATRSVVASGTGSLSVDGDLQLDSATVTASKAANAALTAAGNLTITSNGAASSTGATPGLGANLSLIGARVAQNGNVVLPSGTLNLKATGADADALSFGAGSLTSVAGSKVALGSGSAYTSGGTINATADGGGIVVAQGATLDVSAYSSRDSSGVVQVAGGDAGVLNLSAINGTVDLSGTLLGTALLAADSNGVYRTGGKLSVDAQNAQDLAALASQLAAQEDAAGVLRNFGGALSLRNRSGDQTLDEGVTLKSANVALTTDSGKLAINGTINADGAQGGKVSLSAAVSDASQTALELGRTASITARAQQLSTATTAYDGGTVSLNAEKGRISLAQDASIDVSPKWAADADAAAQAAAVKVYGGKVTLRAQQTGSSVDVVAIDLTSGTDASKTIVQGAKSVSVEGFKVYNGSSLTTTLKNSITTNAATFANSASVVSANLAALTGGTLNVLAGAEINSSGDFSLASAWSLWSASNYHPVNLTIRAAGNLNVTASLSDGFDTKGIAQTGVASSFNLVGGADASSADVLATTAGAGNVNIGGSSSVLVRSTTGDINIAAGNDIQFVNGKAAVYTTGEPIALSTLGSFIAPTSLNVVGLQQLFSATGGTSYYKWLLTTGSTSANIKAGVAANPFVAGTAASLFYANGGSVSLNARHDVIGYAATTDTELSPSNWKYSFYDTVSGQTMWWSRYDLYTQGIASFGGGNVTVTAGQDISDAQVDAVGSGYLTAAGTRNAYAAGNVTIEAGRDVIGGNVVAEGATLRVQAGRDITGANSGSELARDSGLGIWIGNTTATVQAAQNVALNGLGNSGRAAQFLADPRVSYDSSTADQIQAYSDALHAHVSELFTNSVSEVQASGGDLVVNTTGSSAGSVVLSSALAPGRTATVVTTDEQPGYLLLAATAGSVSIQGDLNQKLPASSNSGLAVLAMNNLTFTGAVLQSASQVGGETGTGQLGVDPDSVVRGQNQLIAADGSVSFSSTVGLARSTLMQAGLDISMSPDSQVTIQHQGVTEVSALEAGRDIIFGTRGDGTSSAGLTVRGPGDLIVAAGRDVSLGSSNGIVANGNQDNSALPAESANISVMAGVSLLPGSEDFRSAIAQGYAQSPAALVRLLSALAQGQAVADPAIQAAELQSEALSALPVGAQSEALRNVIGSSDFGDVLVTYVKAQTGAASLTVAQAQVLYAGLSADQRGGLVTSKAALGALQAHYRSLTSSEQQAAAFAGLSLTQQLADLQTALGSSRYNAALLAYVETKTGSSGLTLAQAQTRFEQMDAATQAGLIDASAASLQAVFAGLSFERQVLFVQQALQGDVRAAGRESVAATTKAAQQAAYAKAYAAINQVLPGTRSEGNVLMARSQIKTTQDGDVSMLVPGGYVNAGLTSGSGSSKSADQLGIVTVAGGDISAITSDDFLVNSSRVFTVADGDMLIWSSDGSIDAGKGAKTVVGAPPPTYYIDKSGHLAVNTSASYSGSGIAVLGATSVLDLYAPAGTIDSGDAGIRAGKAYINGDVVKCKVCGVTSQVAISLPTPPAPVAVNFSLSATPKDSMDSTSAGDSNSSRMAKARPTVQVDFVSFGSDDGSDKAENDNNKR